MALLTLAGLLLSSCGGDKHHAQIRVLNVSLGYQSLDLFVNLNGNSSSDTELESGVGYKSLTSYASVDSGKYEVKFRTHGSSSNLADIGSDSFADETHTTYVTYGSSSNFGTLKLSEDVGDQDSGKSGLQVFNVAEAGALDIYLTDSATNITDASPTFSSVAAGSSSSSLALDKGTYRLRVYGAGSKTDLRLDVASITLNDQKNATLILTASQGGVLVNSMFLQQQGSSLTENDNTNARVRAAVGMSDGNYADVSVNGISLASHYTTGAITSGYSQVTAGTVSLSVDVDGNPVDVSNANTTLAAGGDYTILVWSNANGNQVATISDDNHLPITSGKLKMRIINGVSGLGDPVTLSANFSPVVENVAVGTASASEEIDSGDNNELDVTDYSVGGDPIFSLSDVSLSTGVVYTMFVVGGGSGVKVNGALHKDAPAN